MKAAAVPADSPETYVAALTGWQRPLVEALRAHVLSCAGLEERIKWGHLVYFANGPAALIRAEEERVLFGFWRGQRLRSIEPRLKPGGRYEMATVVLREGDGVDGRTARQLVTEAVRLNEEIGDPDEACGAGSGSGGARQHVGRGDAESVSRMTRPEAALSGKTRKLTSPSSSSGERGRRPARRPGDPCLTGQQATG